MVSDGFQAGSVKARQIKGNVYTGLIASDPAVVSQALSTMSGFQGGAVEVSGTIEGDVYTGLTVRVSDPEAAQVEFLAELRALNERLAMVRADEAAPAEVKAAADAVDAAATEAEKPEPLAKVIGNRLREAVELLTDTQKAMDAAGTVLDSAGKVAQQVAQALPQAIALYEVARVLLKLG